MPYRFRNESYERHESKRSGDIVNHTARKLLLKTRKQVFGEMIGNNSSLFHGEGFEFAELREYIYGDDVRKIDWKTTAKLGKPYVKVYHEERELNVVVSTMLNGSTYFGIERPKYEVIAELIGLIGFSAVSNGDLFSHMIFADELYRHSKPSKKFFAVGKEIEESLSFDPLGKRGNFRAWSDTLYRRIKKRSLLFMISDFVGDIDLGILSKKHDLFLIIVRDRFEEKPTDLGYLRLVDTDGGGSFDGFAGGSAFARYKTALKANDDALMRQISKNGIRYAKIYTDEEPFVKLLKRMR
jgi:uncharacterized protein (DUF58 family)